MMLWKRHWSGWTPTTLTCCSSTSPQATISQVTGLWRKPTKRARCAPLAFPTLPGAGAGDSGHLRGKACRAPNRGAPLLAGEGTEGIPQEEGIVIQAWYPLGHGDKALIQEPLFTEFGKKYGKSSAQIILRWHIQAGNIVIPGSKNPAHIQRQFQPV